VSLIRSKIIQEERHGFEIRGMYLGIVICNATYEGKSERKVCFKGISTVTNPMKHNHTISQIFFKIMLLYSLKYF